MRSRRLPWGPLVGAALAVAGAGAADGTKGRVALTFDDLPAHSSLPPGLGRADAGTVAWNAADIAWLGHLDGLKGDLTILENLDVAERLRTDTEPYGPRLEEAGIPIGVVEDSPMILPLRRKVTSTIGMTEIIPVSCGDGMAEPLGSGYLSLTALSRSDGWILIPAESEGFPAASKVAVHQWP